MKREKGLLEDLRSVEVNTIIKDDMSAEKMPALPFALLDIIQMYGCKLQIELDIDLQPYLAPTPVACWDALIEGMKQGALDGECLLAVANAHETLRVLRQWSAETKPDAGALYELNERASPADKLALFNCLPDLWAVFEVLPKAAPSPGAKPLYGVVGQSFWMDQVNNGWDTFERLRRALVDAKGELDEADRGVDRIIINCSHIKYLVQGLQQKPPPTKDTSYAALADLIPTTRDELLRATVRHKKVPHNLLEPEQMNVVRKAWEFGTEEVVAQTCVQLDGDVLTRISRQLLEGELADHHDRVLAAHHAAIDTGLSHWNNMLDTALKFLGAVVDTLAKR